MKVIYTDAPQKPKEGEVYRLISPFFGVISAVTEVVIDGDAPHIEQAYRKAGIEVTSEDKATEDQEGKAAEGMTVDELRAYLTELGVEFDSKAKKADLLKLAKEQ